MNASTLGRRYERLLFLAAPISFISFLLLFVAIASTNQAEKKTAMCLEQGAEILKSDIPKFHTFWENVENRSDTYGSGYRYEMTMAILLGRPNLDCYDLLKNRLEDFLKLPPHKIITDWRNEAEKLLRSPIQFWGIELPEKTKIDVFGTPIKIELMTLIWLLQLAISPIMVLWLGSLYQTRYRESLLIESAKAVSEIFPHVINSYPSLHPITDYSISRKRFRILQYFPYINSFLYTWWRVFLVTVFVAPSVIAYLYSVLILNSIDINPIMFLIIPFIGFLSFLTVLVEFMPWHYSKKFF